MAKDGNNDRCRALLDRRVRLRGKFSVLDRRHDQLVPIRRLYVYFGCWVVGYPGHRLAYAGDGVLAQDPSAQLARWRGAKRINVPFKLFALARSNMVKACDWMVNLLGKASLLI